MSENGNISSPATKRPNYYIVAAEFGLIGTVTRLTAGIGGSACFAGRCLMCLAPMSKLSAIAPAAQPARGAARGPRGGLHPGVVTVEKESGPARDGASPRVVEPGLPKARGLDAMGCRSVDLRPRRRTKRLPRGQLQPLRPSVGAAVSGPRRWMRY